MASWWTTDIRFKSITKKQRKKLQNDLKNKDRDFHINTIYVYRDGIVGKWRSPLLTPIELKNFLEKQKIQLISWVFEPRKCDDKTCYCHQLDHFGCLFSPDP